MKKNLMLKVMKLSNKLFPNFWASKQPSNPNAENLGKANYSART